MWKFIRNHLSIDEFKVSALIIAFMGLIALIVYMTLTQGDFSSNLLALVSTLIVTIGGVNAVGGVATIIQSKMSTPEVVEENTQSQVIDGVTYGEQGVQDEK